MLCEKCLGIPVWLWLVIIGIIVFSCYKTSEKFKTTEKFVETPTIPTQTKVKVYNFTAPSWCGYSRNFSGIWSEFTSKIKTKYPDIDVVTVEFTDMNTTPKENLELADKFGIKGYPTVIFEVNDKRIEYEGERSVDEMETAVVKLLQ